MSLLEPTFNRNEYARVMYINDTQDDQDRHFRYGTHLNITIRCDEIANDDAHL